MDYTTAFFKLRVFSSRASIRFTLPIFAVALTATIIFPDVVLAESSRLFSVELTNDDNLSRAQPGGAVNGSMGVAGSYATASRNL